MFEKKAPINQTQFSFEEPIFEKEQVYIEETTPEQEEARRKKKKKLFKIIAVLAVVLILLATMILMIVNRKGLPEIIFNPPPATMAPELTPLQLRIQDAREQLNLADPAKQDLSFPPIDLNIRLDPVTR